MASFLIPHKPYNNRKRTKSAEKMRYNSSQETQVYKGFNNK